MERTVDPALLSIIDKRFIAITREMLEAFIGGGGYRDPRKRDPLVLKEEVTNDIGSEKCKERLLSRYNLLASNITLAPSLLWALGIYN